MVNVRDVAKASGVSITTVSAIINNKPINIREDTRQRVIDVMRQLNYRPTPKTKKSKTRRQDIGVFIGTGPIVLPTQAFYTSILEGIVTQGTANQYNVTLYCAMTWGDIRQDLREYVDGRCDGIILLTPGYHNEELYLAIHERAIPAVGINTSLQSNTISTIDIDDFQSAYEAVSYLIQRGHKRISMLGGTPSTHPASDLRDEGYYKAMADNGLEPKAEWNAPGVYSWESGYVRIKRIYPITPRELWPTAVFCHCDSIAYGVYKAFEELSISVPGDVSVIGIDDIPVAKELNPPLTTMRQPLHKLGVRATEILVEEINKEIPDRTVRRELYPTDLVIRGSVAEPREYGNK